MQSLFPPHFQYAFQKAMTTITQTMYLNRIFLSYAIYINLTNTGYKGAPNLVIEVLSPSTSRNDRVKKYNTYQRFGVHEYWIIDPANETVEIYVLENGIYQGWNVYGMEDVITSKQFEELAISAEDMFSY